MKNAYFDFRRRKSFLEVMCKIKYVLVKPNSYQVITNIQPCLFSQDILDERGERLSQESHELTSKGIWPFPESNHETFNKIRQKMKEVHFEAKTKKMQDRISAAAGHTFWLNQELGLKRVAAQLCCCWQNWILSHSFQKLQIEL